MSPAPSAEPARRARPSPPHRNSLRARRLELAAAPRYQMGRVQARDVGGRAFDTARQAGANRRQIFDVAHHAPRRQNTWQDVSQFGAPKATPWRTAIPRACEGTNLMADTGALPDQRFTHPVQRPRSRLRSGRLRRDTPCARPTAQSLDGLVVSLGAAHVRAPRDHHFHNRYDLDKNSSGVVDLDRGGLRRQKCSRGEVETRLAPMPPRLIGIDACVGAHSRAA